MKNMKQELYTAEDLKSLLSILVNDDVLTIYGAADVQKIFGLGSIDSAYRLMRCPSFPSMKNGKALRETKGNLIKFIEANSTGTIVLE